MKNKIDNKAMITTFKKEESNKSVSLKANSPKKTFVEPVISIPVDVLEATTFFQVVDSGATN